MEEKSYMYSQDPHHRHLHEEPIERNTFIFAFLMVLFQIMICLIYGFLVIVPPSFINTASIITTICLAILIVGGFGLLFAYTGRMAWSALGFTFLIMALCIQYYPLINDFWTKTRLQGQNTPILDFSFNNRFYSFYLSNHDVATTNSSTESPYYGNCITNAFKCALSLACAFSVLLGRAGALECLLTVVIGTVGFELNRQIVQQNVGADSFGTFYIFAFGGFMGLGLALWQKIRESRKKDDDYYYLPQIQSLRRYTGQHPTVTYSLFGALVIFCFFPFLAYDIDSYLFYDEKQTFSSPVAIIVGMGSGTIGAFAISLFINGNAIVRDCLGGVVAGAIITGASAHYISQPVYAFITGFSGGVIQSLIQNLFEKTTAREGKVLSYTSWSLFGIQGFLGACFASGWKAISYTNQYDFPKTNTILNFYSQNQLWCGFISVGIGLGFGVITGLFIFLINGASGKSYWQDSYYWKYSDGIRYRKEQNKSEAITYADEQIDLEQGSQIKNQHAYL